MNSCFYEAEALRTPAFQLYFRRAGKAPGKYQQRKKKQTNKKPGVACQRLDFRLRKREAKKEKSVEDGDEVKEKPAAAAGPCALQR